MQGGEEINILKIDVSGDNQALWEQLRSKLIAAVGNFLDSTIDVETGSTIRQEAQKFTSLALDYGKSKLQKAGIENDKIIAEIEEKYAVIEKTKAEGRKLVAEAKQIEFDTSLRKLKASLKLAKALVIGKQDEESIVFTRQIEGFLEAINEVTNERPL